MKKVPIIKSSIRRWNAFFIGFDILCFLRRMLLFTLALEFGFEGLNWLGVFNTIASLLVLSSIIICGALIARGKKLGLYIYIVLVPVRFYTGLFTFSFLSDLLPLSILEQVETPIILFFVLGGLEAIRLYYSIKVYSKFTSGNVTGDTSLIDN